MIIYEVHKKSRRVEKIWRVIAETNRDLLLSFYRDFPEVFDSERWEND